jgi:hypothetical protein
MDMIKGLISVLVGYMILTTAYATLLPTASAITIVGINFGFVIVIAVIVVVFKWLQKSGNWK